MQLNEVRSLFPHLKTGRIYFNHAAISPISSLVRNKIENYLIERSETKVENFESILPVLVDTKKKLAALISTSPDRIAFVDNTSNGLNILAQGLKWKPGDEIILNDIEFPANVYPFLNLQNRGVKIIFAKSENGKVTPGIIEKLITPNTKLISVSMVQFLSGYRIDLDPLSEICRVNNIILAVDAIQGLGALKLNVKDTQIDFISCGGHKWLMGIQGLGFIYLTEKLQEKINPAYAGWLSVEDAWNLLHFNFELKKNADRFQTGTMNIIGIYALNAALTLFENYRYEQIENNIIANTVYFTKRLSEAGLKPLTLNYLKSELSGIVSFNHPEAEKIFTAMKKEMIDSSLREGMIRFSPHFYNSSDEIDKVVLFIKEFL